MRVGSEGSGEEDGGSGQQQVAPALVNGSPKLPRIQAPTASSPHQPECYDVTLQRKDNEGFGFVILTSKNKPPPGGEMYSNSILQLCMDDAVWQFRDSSLQYKT